ncbi:MAG: hypothetical protein RIS44_2826, partial [Pseudomonadota bacterium]
MQTFLILKDVGLILKEVASILKDLGFSFWQVTLVLLVLFFRHELRELSKRVKSVRVAGSEVTLQESFF